MSLASMRKTLRRLEVESGMKPATDLSRYGEAGRRSEKKTAKAMGGKLVPQSGAGNSKGDFTVGDMLVEHKSTRARSFSLKLAELVKVWHEALMTGRKPYFVVTFEDASGEPRPDGRWVLMPVEVFNGLCLGKNKRRKRT